MFISKTTNIQHKTVDFYELNYSGSVEALGDDFLKLLGAFVNLRRLRYEGSGPAVNRYLYALSLSVKLTLPPLPFICHKAVLAGERKTPTFR